MTTQERTDAPDHATIRVENREPRTIILGDGGLQPNGRSVPGTTLPPGPGSHVTDGGMTPTQRHRFLMSVQRKVTRGASLVVERRAAEGDFEPVSAADLAAIVQEAKVAADEHTYRLRKEVASERAAALRAGATPETD